MATVRAGGAVLVERRDAIARVTFNRPEKRNAVDWDMWQELLEVFRDLEGDDTVRIVVLTGAGEGFCAGADLTGAPPDIHPYRRLDRINAVVQTLHEIPVITIARVNGDAVGAGANLALACDIVVASEDSRMGEIFVQRGLSIDTGGSWVLPRLIGLHRAKELCLTGALITGREAAAMGLVNRCVTEDDLDEEIDDLIERLLAGAPVAQILTKRLLNEGSRSSLSQALANEAAAQVVNVGSSDLEEARQAFVQRRPAHYTGAWGTRRP